MARTPARPAAVDDLAREVCGDAPDAPTAEELAGWLAGSPRFRRFVEAHRDKIRKKLRGAADAEARRDVRAELAVARLLLADRRIELAFEAYGSGRRGPDFSVSHRGSAAFNLEVTRPRGGAGASVHGGPLLAKLRQLPPSVPNAVLLALDADDAAAVDTAGTIRRLRARADAKNEAFFTSRGHDGTRGFYQQLLRLGGVIAWCEAATGEARAALWTNASARIALPERAMRACLDCLRAG